MKNVAILGFGTVGSGVYEMLCQNAEKIRKKVFVFPRIVQGEGDCDEKGKTEEEGE